MKTEHIPIHFTPRAYLFDHRQESRPVLPAVEALQWLGRSIRTVVPAAALSVQAQARFDKFLYLDHFTDGTIIECFSRIRMDTSDTTSCCLMTKNRVGRGAFTRIKEHVSVNFVTRTAPTPSRKPPGKPASDRFDISAERLYRDLVPFGPAYRNLAGRVTLWSDGAAADIVAPRIEDSTWVLGSSFVLDAAFHAACAWGQRHAGVVGFPVSFERRVIHQPTMAGRSYRTSIHSASERLRFDVWIHDTAGRLCETVTGVCMRDVSGGRVKPPDWVVA